MLICLVSALALALVTLGLRQQRLDMSNQCNRLHGQIESQQARLWNQQLQIATYTAPNAISKTIGEHDLKLVPRATATVGPTIDEAHNVDAE
jgi:cell division protein FtsL